MTRRDNALRRANRHHMPPHYAHQSQLTHNASVAATPEASEVRNMYIRVCKSISRISPIFGVRACYRRRVYRSAGEFMNTTARAAFATHATTNPPMAPLMRDYTRARARMRMHRNRPKVAVKLIELHSAACAAHFVAKISGVCWFFFFGWLVLVICCTKEDRYYCSAFICIWACACS